VADLLGGICTNAVPRRVWNEAAAETDHGRLQYASILYTRPHLPQGAPTSPALANVCAYPVDCRLTGLAPSAGGNTRATPTIVRHERKGPRRAQCV
jgi:hypothetical protein